MHVDLGREGVIELVGMIETAEKVKRRRGRPTKAEAAAYVEQAIKEIEVRGDRKVEEYYAIAAYESQGMELWKAYMVAKGLRDEGWCREKARELAQDETFGKIRARFAEVKVREGDSIKAEITAMYLQMMRNEELSAKERVMAAKELSEICGFKTQKVEVMVDTVAEYAKKHLERTASEPLVLESAGDGDVIDV